MNKKSNIEKGYEYELFINNSLNSLDGNNSWLWNNIPEFELRNATILGDWNEYRFNRKTLKNSVENKLIDTGCDILLKQNNKYIIVQCKNYAEKNYVTIEDLAGFFMMTKLYNLDGIVYYTSKLSINLNCQKKSDNIKFIKNTFESIEIKDNILIDNKYNNIICNAYDYQIEAYNILKETFSKDHRAILQLPCGLGKTLISMKVGLDYDTVVIISPLKQYCIQNLDVFKSEIAYKDYESLIIDSDGTRSIFEISKFIKNNKKIILSVCIKSCDILFKVLDKLKNYIIIVDEFHNISKNDIMFPETGMYNILHSKSKIMFMSATPRIFYFDNNDEEYDFYEEIFGKIVYKWNMGDAIKAKKICDYEIYVPDIKLDNQVSIDDISKEINIEKLDNIIVKKCNYFLRGLLETGCRKSIIYVTTHVEAEQFKNTFILLNEYFALEMNVDTLLSSNTKNERDEKLKLFTDFNGFSLLINVYILNECIDKKECDSIFITYPSQSKISNIQRICRANRIDKNNIHKISRIFLWCDEYQNDLVDIISHLKEFDNTFCTDKVKIMTICNSNDLVLKRDKSMKEYEVLDKIIVDIKIAYSWMDKFNSLQKYISEYKCIPSIGKQTDNNIEFKRLASWIKNQKFNFKKKIKMMKYEKYYNLWKNFMEHNPEKFLNNEEKWINKLDKLKEFIDLNHKTPSKYAKDKNTDDDSDDESLEEFPESNLGSWFDTQKGNFKKEVKMFRVITLDGIKKYEHQHIVDLWNDFNNRYSKYLLQGKEQWYARLNELKVFLDQNKDKKQKSPSSTSKDSNIKSLATFIVTQEKNYKSKSQIMKEEDIYDTWTKFVEEYKDSLMSQEEIWLKTLESLKDFMNKYNKRPNKHSTNPNEKKLGEWLVKQTGNYNNKRGVMNKNLVCYEHFKNLLVEYSNII